MITKNEVANILKLKDKKGRQEQGLYCCEGVKLVSEMFLSGIQPYKIFATSEWLQSNEHIINRNLEFEEVSASELKKISHLATPNEVLALLPIPKRILSFENLKNQLTLVLDTIQDPGNLGTILRIAEWFGINTVICSESTADIFNPKVVQATMGSIFRTAVYYVKLAPFFSQAQAELKLPVYGAFLNGDSLYKGNLQKVGFIVMGNESQGISLEIAPFITHKITIPSYAATIGGASAESLNVSVATAIICAEFRRE